ncbi:MAG TPA: SDR family oxidoreductase [Pseudogracilibacillus sp.]|nr:SDR family oxidoreductase [Pseudogracilibacillus sp.]
MDLNLSKKIVLITGASKGIGKAIATEFARENAIVYLMSRTELNLKETTEEIIKETENSHVNYKVGDLKNGKDINQVVEEIKKAHGKIDVLINNAGGPPPGGFLDVEEEDWYHAFEQNLLSVVRMTKAVIPLMIESGSGRIINITSSSIKASIDNLILSNVMRPGVHGLTKSLAQEFAKDNILVNTIGPGKIKTDRTLELSKATAEKTGKTVEEVVENMSENIPIGRLGLPAEFAKIAVFLASGANTYVTGQALLVDGASVSAL